MGKEFLLKSLIKIKTSKMENQKDKQVQELFKIVQQKKAEIIKAEKPNWLTNCSFGYNKDSSARQNIQVVSDVEELISILGFLIEKEKGFDAAQQVLGTSETFKWLGFTVEEWQSDIQTRINKIQISKKKKELDAIETKLNSLVSKEMREALELAEITKALGL